MMYCNISAWPTIIAASYLFNCGKWHLSKSSQHLTQRGFWFRLLRCYRSRLRCIRESVRSHKPGWNYLSGLCSRSIVYCGMEVAWKKLAWLAVHVTACKTCCLFTHESPFLLPDNKSSIFFQGCGENLK